MRASDILDNGTMQCCGYSILNREEILELCRRGMITPFVEEKTREIDGKPAISFGAGAFGYDIRLDGKFKTPIKGWVLDPKQTDHKFSESATVEPFLLAKNSFVCFACGNPFL